MDEADMAQGHEEIERDTRVAAVRREAERQRLAAEAMGSVTNCTWCGDPIEPDLQSRSSRFCSSECGKDSQRHEQLLKRTGGRR